MSVPENVLWEMRRNGNHPDAEMNNVELAIASSAYQKICNEPDWAQLSPRTAYNFLWLNTFYGTQNPQLIRLLQRLEPYPRMVEMEVVQGVCPLRCIQCELTYSLYKEPIQVSFEDFKYVMDQFPDLGWAGNNGLGDPFTNPRYNDMVKYVDDKEVPQEIYLTSQLLSETDMQRFVDYKSFLLTKFSFDGATKETYEKVRPGVSFDKVVSNIKALDRYKRQRGKLWPKIEFHYLLLKQNLHEAEQFIEFIDSLDINCSGIMFSKLLHYYPEIEGIYTEIPVGLGEKLIEKGKNYGIPVYFNGDTLENKPAANMCTQWLMTYVFPDGTVIPCCNPNEANVRYKQREWSMGNVFETPFREIWEGEKYKKLRKTLMMGDKENYMPVCKNLCAIHNIDKVECF